VAAGQEAGTAADDVVRYYKMTELYIGPKLASVLLTCLATDRWEAR
jgi:hypothetical protein